MSASYCVCVGLAVQFYPYFLSLSVISLTLRLGEGLYLISSLRLPNVAVFYFFL